MIFRVQRDVSSLIKAAEHHKHIDGCLDSGVPNTLGSIWQHTEDQRTYAFVFVVEFGFEVLHHLDDNIFIRPFGIWVIQALCVHKRNFTNGTLFEATSD